LCAVEGKRQRALALLASRRGGRRDRGHGPRGRRHCRRWKPGRRRLRAQLHGGQAVGLDWTEIWRRSLAAGSASELAVDPEGNIVAAGETYEPSHFTVVKLAASDGAVLWQQDPTDLLYDVEQAIGPAPHTLATDAAGDVVAAGLAVDFQATVIK